MSKPEVRVYIVEKDGKTMCAVDKIDRENQVFQSLKHHGEWQDVPFYSPSPPETLFVLRGTES